MTSERTIPRYQSDPPTGYSDWNEYFKAAKTPRESETVILRPQEVIQKARPVDPESISGRTTVGKIAKAAKAAGWHVQANRSKYRTADRRRGGEIVKGRVEEYTYVGGMIAGEEGHIFYASKDSFKFDYVNLGSLDELLIAIDEHGVRDE